MKGTNNQVYSVLAGFPVTFSSRYAHEDCQLCRLDAERYAWSPAANNEHQWIQVSSIKPETWIGVVTQGRQNYDQRVTEYRVSYTINGVDWSYVDGGKTFVGNHDRSTKVRNNFETSVVARALRIHPTRWNQHIALRFDALFIEA